MEDQSEATRLSASGYDVAPIGEAEREDLAGDLTAEERQVILNHGTEAPFCGTLLNNKEGGLYACRLCGLPLFRSGAKFESGTGWPSFTEALPGAVKTLEDRSFGMTRTEVQCARCGGHLGHVFPDGPRQAGGLRFCMNGCALDLEKREG